MKIKCAHNDLVDIDLLVPNPRNPNKHPDNQIEMLAKIMNHQGWRSPVVVSNRSGFITKGHGRLMAARINGWKKIPVDRQDYETEADEYADMVADNKIAELAQTDMEMVKTDMLEFPDLDLGLLGISDLSLDPWESDIDTIGKTDETLEGIPAVIKVTCPQDIKDEVLIYLKAKFLETSFEGVHIE